jgi:SAM-dependent methyltransferase
VHDQVLDWIAEFRSSDDLAVLDIGGRDLNGSPRMLFPNAAPYHVLDLRPGPNVDYVGDATSWKAEKPYDLVICTEVFEHAEKWREIILTAWDSLRPGGWFLFTCAGPGRPPHSGIEPVWGLIDGEWYANVSPEEARQELTDQGWTEIEVHLRGTDTQGKAVKPVPRPREVLLSAELTRTASV